MKVVEGEREFQGVDERMMRSEDSRVFIHQEMNADDAGMISVTGLSRKEVAERKKSNSRSQETWVKKGERKEGSMD